MANIAVDVEHAQEFYDARYLEGYMDDWPAWKKRRVADLVRSLPLARSGRALDFGCGSGVFTEVLQAALPEWTIVGTELSPVALEQARRRNSRCQYLKAAAVAAAGPFDFIFTHHVLEHVTDLSRVFAEMSAVLTASGTMLHVLPCGNEGSLERRICEWRRDGIQADAGGRFFFEDAGHLRRLTSRGLEDALRSFGFVLARAWFANQRWGTIAWVTELDLGFILSFVNPAKARGVRAFSSLAVWAAALSTVRAFKRGVARFGAGGRRLAATVQKRADSEWLARREDPGGSEMYLFFQRAGR